MPAESTRRDKVEEKGASGKKGASGGALLMLLFSATIFISAALLFLVQPMFAKFVLPSFGGTPAVWTGSMMFFQATLLVGYLYVHATTTWLGARRQAILHLVVVLLPLLVLPLAVPGEEWAPSSQANPIFLLLCGCGVGAPQHNRRGEDQHHQQPVPYRPPDALVRERELPLDDQRIAEETDHAAQVRGPVQKVGVPGGRMIRICQPPLHQRVRRGDRKKREPHGRHHQPE